MELPCSKCGKVGVNWCNQAACPLFPKVHIPAKESFSGSTPNLFIGRHNYPNVNIGFLATEEYNQHDNPKEWTAQETPITEIVRLRSMLVNSKFSGNVREFPERYDEMRSLVAQAIKPVDVDIELAKKPTFTINYPQGTTPHGPSVDLKHAELTENVHIPTEVDKALSDDLLATEQLSILSAKHDEYYLQKLFSAGLLGQDKKLVPTRWSITAVDDTLGKEAIETLKEFPSVNEPTVFVGGHYGNYYCIIILPGKWSYELFEMYVGSRAMPDKLWTDYEPYSGRKNYAENTVGGYYAARLNIARKLIEEKRQGNVLVFRFVTDEYTNPLGVWVVREAVGLAMQTKPLRFASEELAITYVRSYAKKKFSYNIDEHLTNSKLLWARKQKQLDNFK